MEDGRDWKWMMPCPKRDGRKNYILVLVLVLVHVVLVSLVL